MEQRNIGWYDRQLIRQALALRSTAERAMAAIEIPELLAAQDSFRDALAARGMVLRSTLRIQLVLWSCLARLLGKRAFVLPGNPSVRVDAELLCVLLAFCREVLRFERPRWRLERTWCPACGVNQQVPRLLRLEWMRQHMEEHQDRVAGVLIGLAAGDENGGPTEMALRLAESLLELRRYDPDDVFARYLDWHREGSYDTGPVTGRVLSHALRGMPRPRAVEQVDRELKGMTAGCNAAHRVGVLAMAPWLTILDLVEAAGEEARLTHHHPIAADSAVAVAARCRDEIMGSSRHAPHYLDAVSQRLHPEVKEAVLGPRPSLEQLLDPTSRARSRLHRDGYSPGTLHAALAFSTAERDPAQVLAAAKSFAGPANYCPVLVGAFLGARFGATAFDDDQLRHHPPEHIARVRRAARGLAELWSPNQELAMPARKVKQRADSTNKKRRPRPPKLNRQELERAILLDYEGNSPVRGGQDQPPPTLLGYLVDGELAAGIVEPLFARHCSGRYRATHAVAAGHAELVTGLLERAERESRVIVSWSQHDLKVMIRAAPELEARLAAVHRNAIKSVRKHFQQRGFVLRRGKATLYGVCELLGIQVVDRFGLGLVGEGLRLIRSQLEEGRDYRNLTPRARKAWQVIVKHNRQDLLTMREVLERATADEPH